MRCWRSAPAAAAAAAAGAPAPDEGVVDLAALDGVLAALDVARGVLSAGTSDRSGCGCKAAVVILAAAGVRFYALSLGGEHLHDPQVDGQYMPLAAEAATYAPVAAEGCSRIHSVTLTTHHWVW
jgi:hypothetical protein